MQKHNFFAKFICFQCGVLRIEQFAKVLFLMLLAICFSSANAYYYSDFKHSPSVYTDRTTWHHTVTVRMNADESARDFCRDFVNKHATDSVEWRLRVECGIGSDGSTEAGYMCDDYREWTPGIWSCFGDSWYLSLRSCPANTAWVSGSRKSGCFLIIDKPIDIPKHCPAPGNPIHPSTGAKTQTQPLGISVAKTGLSLLYDSRSKMRAVLPPNVPSTETTSFPSSHPQQEIFGKLWGLNIQKSMQLFAIRGRLASALVTKQGGVSELLLPTSETDLTSTQDPNSRLRMGSGGWYDIWRFTNAKEGAIETYSRIAEGFGNTESHLLGAISFVDGGALTLKYSDASTPSDVAPRRGLLISVIDHFGRSVSFKYNTEGMVSELTGPDIQSTTRITYTGNNISGISWADTTARRFHYEKETLPWALTGLSDESGIRIGRYSYDAATNAAIETLSDTAGAFSTTYDSMPGMTCSDQIDEDREVIYRVCTWNTPTNVKLKLPNGGESLLSFKSVQGVPHLTSQSQPAGSGCTASVKQQDYDANGNVAWREDFNGYRTCYMHDLNRNLEIGRIEGLTSNTSCAALLPADTSLPGNSRRVSTQSHPIWRLEEKVAEARRLTTKVYNGQPDPFNGGATAWCAPSNATLPDGSPIVVLCKQVEQATTDANGAAGYPQPWTRQSRPAPSGGPTPSTAKSSRPRTR